MMRDATAGIYELAGEGIIKNLLLNISVGIKNKGWIIMLRMARVFAVMICLAGMFGCGVGKPELPVKVIIRESLAGEGMVAQFHSEFPQKIVVYVVLESKEYGAKRESNLALDPNGMTEIGWLQDWKFLPGDTITISHSDYKTSRYKVK